jgi:hypothetical protein
MNSASLFRMLMAVSLSAAPLAGGAQTGADSAAKPGIPTTSSGAASSRPPPGASRSSHVRTSNNAGSEAGMADRGRTRSFQGRHDRSEPADTQGKRN